LYLSLGLKLKKIHRVLEFSQSPWLKKYIDFNTKKRMNTKITFEKEFFKLMNNSVFGKTMENLRNRVNIELVSNEERLNKLSAKLTYVNSKIFNQDLVAVHTKKERLLLDKPSYVGMCILDLSKIHMYDFHYNYIKKSFQIANYFLLILIHFFTLLEVIRMYMKSSGKIRTSSTILTILNLLSSFSKKMKK